MALALGFCAATPACDRSKPGTTRPDGAVTPQPDRGKCSDFELDVERFWSAESKRRVGAGIMSVSREWGAEYQERIVTKMDAITRDWVMMQEGICKDTLEREVMPKEVYVKVSLCLRTVLVSQRTIATALQSPTKENLFSMNETLERVQREALDCQNEAVYGHYTARDEAAAEAREKLAVAETLRRIKSERAKQAATEAAAVARQTEDENVRLQALLDEGSKENAAAHYAEALRLAKAAMLGASQTRNETALAGALNLIGSVYSGQGKWAEALAEYQEALAVRHRALGDDHPDTAATYHNIAVVYSKQGKYAEALAEYQKALVIRRRVLGDDHPDTQATYHNIAIVYSLQGKEAEALAMFEKSLVIDRRVLGDDHPDTADTYNNIAIIYYNQGKYAEALAKYQKALFIRRRVFGEEHPDTAASYHNIASVYYDQGKDAEALAEYRKALAIKRRVLGDDHPDMAATYHCIAVIYGKRGKYAEALALLEKALAIDRRVFGDDHPDTQALRHNIGLLCGAGYQPACAVD